MPLTRLFACLALVLTACSSEEPAGEASGSSGGGGGKAGAKTGESGEPDDDDLAGIVKLHNDVRAEVGTDPLVWSEDVASVAKTYAEQCRWGHNPRSGYGENIFASTGGSSPAAVVGSWADEKKHYQPSTGKCSGGECGHYTQIVWSKTERLGCAKASCTSAGPFGNEPWDYWVCNYDPPGNFSGEKAY